MARLEVRQSWLGDVLGLSQSVVSKRLRGLLPFTGPELLLIASAMNISLGELLGGIVNEKNPHPVDGGSSGVAGGRLDLPTSRL
ncbi:helix-turn-helix domain-containing protein [Brevibacterium sediminis]